MLVLGHRPSIFEHQDALKLYIAHISPPDTFPSLFFFNPLSFVLLNTPPGFCFPLPVVIFSVLPFYLSLISSSRFPFSSYSSVLSFRLVSSILIFFPCAISLRYVSCFAGPCQVRRMSDADRWHAWLENLVRVLPGVEAEARVSAVSKSRNSNSTPRVRKSQSHA